MSRRKRRRRTLAGLDVDFDGRSGNEGGEESREDDGGLHFDDRVEVCESGVW